MHVFVTGASGHVASAVIPELLGAGHQVTGLARSDEGAAKVAALGATVRRGDLQDLDGLAEAAAAADGVIHLAFDHADMQSGNMAGALAKELAVVDAMGDALAGSGKPFVGTSGTLMLVALGLDRPGVETDRGTGEGRIEAENAMFALADRGVRSSVVRLPPITHSDLDHHGFAHTLIDIARSTGVAGHYGDGTNRWPGGNTRDAAKVYRLALEQAEPGTAWHPVEDEGVPMGDLARTIGEHLGLPVAQIPDDRLEAHFGFLALLVCFDNPTSNQITREALGWEPTEPKLLADLATAGYFTAH